MVINLIDWKSLPYDLQFIGDYKSNMLLSLISHQNEPLGVLIDVRNFYKKLTICTNCDIPLDLYNRFDIPCNFFSFIKHMKLNDLANQIEFAYSDNPSSEASFRANQYLDYWVKKDTVIQIHNDPLRSIFYAYTWNSNYLLNSLLESVNVLFLNNHSHLGKVNYTTINDEYIYSFFPLKNILSDYNKQKSFGEMVKNTAVQAVNIEVPMFNWQPISKSDRNYAIQVYLSLTQSSISAAQKNKIIESVCVKKLENIKMYPLSVIRDALNFLVYQTIKILGSTVNKN